MKHNRARCTDCKAGNHCEQCECCDVPEGGACPSLA